MGFLLRTGSPRATRVYVLDFEDLMVMYCELVYAESQVLETSVLLQHLCCEILLYFKRQARVKLNVNLVVN